MVYFAKKKLELILRHIKIISDIKTKLFVDLIVLSQILYFITKNYTFLKIFFCDTTQVSKIPNTNKINYYCLFLLFYAIPECKKTRIRAHQYLYISYINFITVSKYSFKCITKRSSKTRNS